MKTNSQKLLNRINTKNNVVRQELDSDHKVIHINNVVQNALGSDNEVLQCAYVRGGHFKSNYEDWVQNSKPCVRKLIAETYPEYVPLLPCETDWELNKVQNYLLERTTPKLDVLEKFLSKVDPAQNHNTEIIALRLKHETMIRKMTAIEKTMDLTQLWQSNSPFWTEKLDGNEIVDVLSAYHLSDKSQGEFNFENAYNTAKHPLHRRVRMARPYLNIDEELLNILNEEPKCGKILTPLIC